MRMRKLLPLVILAIGSVFLLSSCDAMLDAIFSNNTITVYISASISTYGYFPSYNTMSVAISGPTLASATAAYTGSDGLYMYWSVSVPKLSDGSYSVQVTYNNPYGTGPINPSKLQYISLPSGSSHNVNLAFNF